MNYLSGCPVIVRRACVAEKAVMKLNFSISGNNRIKFQFFQMFTKAKFMDINFSNIMNTSSRTMVLCKTSHKKLRVSAVLSYFSMIQVDSG